MTIQNDSPDIGEPIPAQSADAGEVVKYLQLTKNIRRTAAELCAGAPLLSEISSPAGGLNLKCTTAEDARKIAAALNRFQSALPPRLKRITREISAYDQSVRVGSYTFFPRVILSLADDASITTQLVLCIPEDVIDVMTQYVDIFRNDVIIKVAGTTSMRSWNTEDRVKLLHIHRTFLSFARAVLAALTAQPLREVNIKAAGDEVQVWEGEHQIDLTLSQKRMLVTLAVLATNGGESFHVNEWAQLYSGSAKGTPRSEFDTAGSPLKELLQPFDWHAASGNRRIKGLMIRSQMSCEEMTEFLTSHHPKANRKNSS